MKITLQRNSITAKLIASRQTEGQGRGQGQPLRCGERTSVQPGQHGLGAPQPPQAMRAGVRDQGAPHPGTPAPGHGSVSHQARRNNNLNRWPNAFEATSTFPLPVTQWIPPAEMYYPKWSNSTRQQGTGYDLTFKMLLVQHAVIVGGKKSHRGLQTPKTLSTEHAVSRCFSLSPSHQFHCADVYVPITPRGIIKVFRTWGKHSR